MPIEGLGAPIVSHRGWLQIQHRPNMTDDLSRHVLQCGKVMQLLKRLEQHDQTQTARIAAGEARSPFHFVHIGGVRSEEHTSELQSLMRISYAVFRLKKKN